MTMIGVDQLCCVNTPLVSCTIELLLCLPLPSAPQAVTNLHIESSLLAMDSNNIVVSFSWTGPSMRNGSYNYYMTFGGEQVDDYPERRRRNHPNTTVVLDGSNMSLPITGLPYANYTINVTAFNDNQVQVLFSQQGVSKKIIGGSGIPLLRSSKRNTCIHT